MSSRCLIIAEAGVNHNGDLELAKRLATEAYNAGADIVKYQTFQADKLVTPTADKADYQISNTDGEDSQLEMLRSLQLSYEQFRELKAYCDELGIGFLSTAFELESVEFLDELGCNIWKIPSGEITNYPYLVRIARTGKDIIMSTGMCTLDEIGEAINVLRQNGAGGITLMHCTTEYPTPLEDVNLMAIQTLKDSFDVPVGYSDHTEGIDIAIAAVAAGATVIEKHFTLDKNMSGPDHKASLEPYELRKMVQGIRSMEAALGDGIKIPTEGEIKNAKVARKSIVASKPIRSGELFTEDNLTTKRPGTGISPMRWNSVVGTYATRDYGENELIEFL